MQTPSRPASSPQGNSSHSRKNSTRQIQVIHLTTPFTKGRFFARIEPLSFEETSLHLWSESLDDYRLMDNVEIIINIDIGRSFTLCIWEHYSATLGYCSISKKKLILWSYKVSFSINLSVCVFHKTIIIKQSCRNMSMKPGKWFIVTLLISQNISVM